MPHREKTRSRIQNTSQNPKTLLIRKNTSQNPKTRLRIQNTSQNSKTLPKIQKWFGFWKVFLNYGTCFDPYKPPYWWLWRWGSFLPSASPPLGTGGGGGGVYIRKNTPGSSILPTFTHSNTCVRQSIHRHFPNILAGEFVSIVKVESMNLPLYRQFRKSLRLQDVSVLSTKMKIKTLLIIVQLISVLMISHFLNFNSYPLWEKLFRRSTTPMAPFFNMDPHPPLYVSGYILIFSKL